MIRTSLTSLCMALAGLAFAAETGDICQSAEKVIKRFAGKDAAVELKAAPAKDGDHDSYSTEVKDGKLIITGNSPVALCHGYYAALKAQQKGICSWSGNRVGSEAWNSKAQVKGSTPFDYRYYFNVVTYGYTLPYWDWKRWEQEIDYMALHGINAPLALVAQEAITKRVFKRLGLTDQEIDNYFVGPAHLPWMRMGNISGVDGPMPDAWHENQIALQHKILKRMRSLGMKPICPGFAGFVPQALKRVEPGVNIVQTSWCGGRFHNWMVTPDQPIFQKIGTMFIEEWEKEFGKCDHYLIDSFNEMEVPFPPHNTPERYSLMSQYGEAVYNSIKAANPDAIWVMQGWMFGYQRNIWDQKTLAALIEKVPDDKMLLLDEAVDYNKHFWHKQVNWEFHKGFYNKPWIYSVIPNMGGKCGLTGVLDFYANGHLEALNSANKGRLVGHGMAPEGIENNQVVYELMADAAWSTEHIDTAKWLDNYTAARYGTTCPEITKFWELMCKSVYGSFTDHPRYNWQSGPGGPGKGSINTKPEFYQGIESFAAAAPKYKDNALYQADLIEFTAAYVGARVEQLICASERAMNEGDNETAAEYEKGVTELMLAMDKLLESHPVFRMGRWIEFARNCGTTPELKDYYERNARRIVTIWGPPVNDYAARIWSGLIRDFYLPRRQLHVENKLKGAKNNIGQWENQWVEKKRGLSEVKPYKDPNAAAVKLIKRAKELAADTDSGNVEGKPVGSWDKGMISNDWKELSFPVAPADLKSNGSIRLRFTRGSERLLFKSIKIEMDGQVVAESKKEGFAGNPSKENVFKYSIPDSAQGNNSCRIIVTARADKSHDSNGVVELLPAKKKKK